MDRGKTVRRQIPGEQGEFTGILRTAVREDPKDREAALILSDMQNPFTEAYLHFLNSALSYMNEFNAMFQARDILIHKLTSAAPLRNS